MHHHTKVAVRPMKAYVAPRTAADRSIRAAISMPEPGELAPGLSPTPEHDLTYQGGHTIADLRFKNFYVGGADSWASSDIQAIDAALAAAMSDQRLNNVMVQYYPGGSISSTFLGSQVLDGSPPAVVSQGDIEALVASMSDSGAFDGIDLSSTLFNFLLPSGTILNTDEAPTGSAEPAKPRKREDEEEEHEHVSGNVIVPHEDEDSTQGLGGYHGSIHPARNDGQGTVYYSVGVYSETMADGTVNGIPVFDEAWKNVVATFYHELNEARTDPDVEDAIRAGNDPSATKFLGWVSQQGEECGDFPVFEAKPLTEVFQEVELTDGSGTAPIQFQYSNAAHGPEEPRDTPAPPAGRQSDAATA